MNHDLKVVDDEATESIQALFYYAYWTRNEGNGEVFSGIRHLIADDQYHALGRAYTEIFGAYPRGEGFGSPTIHVHHQPAAVVRDLPHPIIYGGDEQPADEFDLALADLINAGLVEQDDEDPLKFVPTLKASMLADVLSGEPIEVSPRDSDEGE